NVDDPNQFVLVEAFRDGAAGAAHVGSEHFKAAIRELPAALARIPEIVNVEVPGTDWSELAEMATPEPEGSLTSLDPCPKLPLRRRARDAVRGGVGDGRTPRFP